MLLVTYIVWLALVLISIFSSPAASQSFGSIRLVGGTTTREGRVEIYYNYQWGTVCDDSWDSSDAEVVCRQLGFDSVTEAVSRAFFGEGTGQIWMDNVFCDGSESRLENCRHNGWGTHNCDHSEDAGVRCSSGDLDGAVRLVGGGSSSEGRVEIFYNNEWGTVCDNNFDQDAADVICRQLGYSGTSFVRSSAYFGRGSGHIMRSIDCGGHESSWTECLYWYWSTTSCSHSEDVGVQCTSYQLSYDGPVRLAGDDFSCEGRVEIYNKNQWGTICDDNFGQGEADVLCRQLGYIQSSTYWTTYDIDTDRGSGPILRYLSCGGYENSWRDCYYDDWDTSTCTHSEDVWIECTCNDHRFSSPTVLGPIIGIVIFVFICICCCSICAALMKNSGSRQHRGGTSTATTGTHQLTTTQPATVPVITNQTPVGADDPPSYNDVTTSPAMYPPQGVHSNAAYSPQNYPKQPYPTQQGITYQAQPGAALDSTQPGVVSYPAQPNVAPCPQQPTVVLYPPEPVVPSQPYPAAYPPPPQGNQTEIPNSQ